MSNPKMDSQRLAARLRAQIPTEDLLARQAVAFLLAHLEECKGQEDMPLALQLESAAAHLPPDSALRLELLALKTRLSPLSPLPRNETNQP